MSHPIKILFVEDSPADVELTLRELRRVGFSTEWQRVETEIDYIAALNDGFDLIVSDYQMPRFGGMRALEILGERKIDVPFILVSGMIGEDTAVEVMKKGAADFLLKDRLARLGPAISHALEQVRLGRERKVAGETLALRERALAEVSQGVLICDENRLTIYANAAFTKITGYAQADILGRNCSLLQGPETDRQTILEMRAALDGQGAFEGEIMNYRKDGRVFWNELSISLIRGGSDSPPRFIGILRDITDRKQAEEQLQQAQKMEAIGTLAGGIAHDFNNILAAIIGYAGLAKMILKNEGVVCDHLSAILQAAARATDLVRQILTFSRKHPLERRPVKLEEITSETLGLLRATIPAMIEFEISLDKNTPTVLADASQIHQIIMNLVTNAAHSMKDRSGVLRVKVERFEITAEMTNDHKLRPGVYARLSVGDTGSGMDEATLERIFDPFFTTKAPGEGTGLGLSVVHGIMDNHDGLITVRSKPGQGTVFDLYFPVYNAGLRVAEVEENEIVPGTGEKILLVDDELLLVRVGQMTLERLGYQVEVATKPSEALAMVQADPQRFAVVLTDQTMPEMTGLSLAAKIRQIRPDLPVILMTGYADLHMTKQTATSGVCQLLLKPIGLSSLSSAMQRALLDNSKG